MAYEIIGSVINFTAAENPCQEYATCETCAASLTNYPDGTQDVCLWADDIPAPAFCFAVKWISLVEATYADMSIESAPELCSSTYDNSIILASKTSRAQNAWAPELDIMNEFASNNSVNNVTIVRRESFPDDAGINPIECALFPKKCAPSLFFDMVSVYNPPEAIIDRVNLANREAMSANLLQDLSNIWDGMSLNQSVIPGMQVAVKNGGSRPFAFPLSVEYAGILYRLDLFQSLNLNVPTTWAELFQICAILRANGKYPSGAGMVDSVANGQPTSYDFGAFSIFLLNVMAKSNGCEYAKNFQAGIVPLNDDQFKAFLQRLATAANALYPPNMWDFDHYKENGLLTLDTYFLVVTGGAGMMMITPEIIQRIPPVLKYLVGIFPFPDYDDIPQPISCEAVKMNAIYVPYQPSGLNNRYFKLFASSFVSNASQLRYMQAGVMPARRDLYTVENRAQYLDHIDEAGMAKILVADELLQLDDFGDDTYKDIFLTTMFNYVVAVTKDRDLGTNDAESLVNSMTESLESSRREIFLGQTKTPELSPGAGDYSSAVMVTMRCATPGSQIFFTTDGTLATSLSNIYSAPVRISSKTKISAIAITPGKLDSFRISASYNVVIKSKNASQTNLIIGVVVGASTVTIIVVYLVLIRRTSNMDSFLIDFKDLTLLEMIGSGGSAELYRAKYKDMDVAAKILKTLNYKNVGAGAQNTKSEESSKKNTSNITGMLSTLDEDSVISLPYDTSNSFSNKYGVIVDEEKALGQNNNSVNNNNNNLNNNNNNNSISYYNSNPNFGATVELANGIKSGLTTASNTMTNWNNTKTSKTSHSSKRGGAGGGGMDKHMKKQLYQEVAIVSQIRHPHVIFLYGYFINNDTMGLVLEFMNSGSLQSVLHNHSLSFSWERLVSLALDAAKGLSFLHAQEPPIIHRDVKSSNFLVDDRLIVKISDFGISTFQAAGGKKNKDIAAEGSIYWMSPQLLTNSGLANSTNHAVPVAAAGVNNKQIALADDVYAFGIVMWEISHRRDPYDDADRTLGTFNADIGYSSYIFSNSSAQNENLSGSRKTLDVAFPVEAIDTQNPNDKQHHPHHQNPSSNLISGSPGHHQPPTQQQQQLQHHAMRISNNSFYSGRGSISIPHGQASHIFTNTATATTATAPPFSSTGGAGASSNNNAIGNSTMNPITTAANNANSDNNNNNNNVGGGGSTTSNTTTSLNAATMSANAFLHKLVDNIANPNVNLRPTIDNDKTPKSLIALVRNAWEHDAALRPTMKILCEQLNEVKMSQDVTEMDAAYEKEIAASKSGDSFSLSKPALNILRYVLSKEEFNAVSTTCVLKQPVSIPSACVFFADIVSYTSHATLSQPEKISSLLNGLFDKYRAVAKANSVFEVETIGDMFIAANGFKEEDESLENMVNFCLAVISILKTYSWKEYSGEDCPVEMRIGIHYGHCVATIIGTKLTLLGDTVNMASRMESSGKPMEIHASSEFVHAWNKGKSKTSIAASWKSRGVINVKGKGPMETYLYLQ